MWVCQLILSNQKCYMTTETANEKNSLWAVVHHYDMMF